MRMIQAVVGVAIASCAHGATTNEPHRPASGVIDAGPTRVRWDSDGHGEILCLVPGVGRYAMRTLPAALRDRFTFVYFDLRGMDDPSFDPASTTLADDVADIEAVRVAIGSDKVAVLGFSSLGMLAAEYAFRHPEHVSRVLMLGTPPSMAGLSAKQGPYFDTQAEDSRRKRFHDQVGALASQPKNSDKRAAFIEWYAAAAPRYFYDATYDPRPLYEGIALNVDVLHHFMGTELDDWSEDRLFMLDVPVFLAVGRYDFAALAESEWSELHHRLKRGTYVVFELSGHYPALEEPERFTREVSAWLDGGR